MKPSGTPENVEIGEETFRTIIQFSYLFFVLSQYMEKPSTENNQLRSCKAKETRQWRRTDGGQTEFYCNANVTKIP
jgi:hypothetical protein